MDGAPAYVEAQAALAAEAVINRRPYPQIVGNRVGALGGQAASNVTDGTVSGCTYRCWLVTPTYAVTDLLVDFGNWRMTPSGLALGANNITVKASIETVAGYSYPLYAYGQRTVTLAPGANVTFSASGVTIPASTNFWVRVYVTNAGASSGTWPLGRTQAANGLESSTYNTTAADLSDSTGQISGSSGTGLGAFMFHPIAVRGVAPYGQKTFCIYGDSIATGVGDDPALLLGYLGGFERGLAASYGWNTITRAGFRGQQMLVNPSNAMQISTGATVILDEMGVNDIYAGVSTLAAMQANKLLEWAAFATRGAHVYQTTITPYVTSTDGFTTLANQTIYLPAQNIVRTSFNDWVRDGAPIVNGAAVAVGTVAAVRTGQLGHPLSGYLEVADIIESARNSGYFKVLANARVVTDAAVSSGTTIITSATAGFTSADKGSVVYLTNGSASFITLIDSVTNTTTAVLHSPPSIAYSAATLKLGGGTQDGLHWGPIGHTGVATLIQASSASGYIS